MPGLAGGGLLVVIALCIILPIALSGSMGGTLPGGAAVGKDPGVSAEAAAPGVTAEPSVPPVSAPELETRDLGILSASIGVPSDYVVSADGFSFANEERGCAVTTSFVWNLGVPIYTLSDVELHLDEIIASVMMGFDVADYTIYSAEYGAVGGRDAYQVCLEGTDASGVSMDMLYLAVQGENPFGCYIILGAWSKGDEAGRREIEDILQSFRCSGVPDMTYSMWYSDNIGIKFIIDNSLALGSVWETEIQLENGVAEIIAIYPTEAAMEIGLGDVNSPDSGGVEVGYVSEYGYGTPEEMLDGQRRFCRGVRRDCGREVRCGLRRRGVALPELLYRLILLQQRRHRHRRPVYLSECHVQRHQSEGGSGSVQSGDGQRPSSVSGGDNNAGAEGKPGLPAPHGRVCRV